MQAGHPAGSNFGPAVDVPQGGKQIIQAVEFSGNDREAIGGRLGGGHRFGREGARQAGPC